MSQADGVQRSHAAGSPRSRPRYSPTFEQLLQGDASRWPSGASATPGNNDHDQEELLGHQNKKSVLTKVKETAKKLRRSLSKKKHGHEDGNNPSWGVTLDDDDEEDEDPEYLGAPMYESEFAPEAYKETARQHPRAIPVVSEKHVLTSTIKHGGDHHHHQEQQQETQRASSGLSNSNKTMTRAMTEKLAPAYAAVSDATHSIASKIAGLTSGNGAAAPSSTEPAAMLSRQYSMPNANPIIITSKATSMAPAAPAAIVTGHSAASDDQTRSSSIIASKITVDNNTTGPTKSSGNVSEARDKPDHSPPRTITEAVTEKLAPAYAAVSGASHAIASKITALTGDAGTEQSTAEIASKATAGESNIASKGTGESNIPSKATEEIATKEVQKHNAVPESKEVVAGSGQQTWDKGVSVKEYLMHKLEPGEDEKALSQVITEAISPRNSPGDGGVVDKVRGALTSFLRSNEPSVSTTKGANSSELTTKAANSSESATKAANLSRPNIPSESTTRAANLTPVRSESAIRAESTITANSSPIPLSTNAHTVTEEENHGKILQAN
ncbi:low-temperature-induced 65 kDa protein-like [Diospyros lotus]|uniref:low-temperature-induced 65 kDa protein-like n=1 Tax=Diospyros lotus TaxID=55363 RepID=UPI00225980DC|nr:low-temperature-induced 65 kDa protein-like [Diospyros lotus]